MLLSRGAMVGSPGAADLKEGPGVAYGENLHEEEGVLAKIVNYRRKRRLNTRHLIHGLLRLLP